MPFAAQQMDLEIIILSTALWPNKSDRERQTILLVWNLIFKKNTEMNLFTKQKQTHRFQKQIYGAQRGNEGGG